MNARSTISRRPRGWIVLLVVVLAGTVTAFLLYSAWSPGALDRPAWLSGIWSAKETAQNPSPASASAAPRPSVSPDSSRRQAESAPSSGQASARTLAEARSLAAVEPQAAAWLDALKGMSWKPGEAFSLQKVYRDKLQSVGSASETAMSQVATLLYEAAVRSGLKTGERHLHPQLPAYAAPGFDAMFEPDRRNLTFYNPFDFTVMLDIRQEGDKTVVLFSGAPSSGWAAPEIEVKTEEVLPSTLMLVDFAMQEGQSVREAGRPGLYVTVIARRQSGAREIVSKDYYPPRPEIVRRAPSGEERQRTGA